MNKLTELAIKKAKPRIKPYKLSDGGGMYLLIQPTGSKWWRLKYRFGGKEKMLSFGVYPDLGLPDAREQREQARKLLANDTDPGVLKKEIKQASLRVANMETTSSFATLATEFHKIKSPMWTAGHAKQWLLNLERYAFPKIGDRQITEIEVLDIVNVMRLIEEKCTFETRDRLLQTISTVFKYAIATGRAKYNPTDIRLALIDRPPVKHFPSIMIKEIPVFLRAFTQYQERNKVSVIAVSAFRLQLLTATRSSEVRLAKWTDFNLEGGVWLIPAEQTGRKGRGERRRSFTVPLSTQVVAIMHNLNAITGHGEYVFPNRNSITKVISENTINNILKGMGYKGKQTGHGFRTLARTALGESGERWEVLEAMLSHVVSNLTAASYIRTDYFEERRGTMQKWADYLDNAVSDIDVAN